MAGLIQKLFYTLGGFARWLYSLFMNLVFDKQYKKHIGYYLFEEEPTENSGLDSNKKNFVIGIFVFCFIIILTEYFS
ncbi:hypothetical protein [Flavobacterium sp.]|jgi:hypothetical protein|uniref:hypothetical protein n=1 Tax=Flavobacterium sp. TaxID=239 RepID=UPI0037C025A4